MADIIHLLPDSVANQIAAGEVIQRPASVVKELLENAVDAGARNIELLVVDAGRTLIQVIDDGKGMSETDARIAFERHATSKISKAEDLFSLTTMGFRGEALPSIAAVSQVSLRTKTADSDLGTSLAIEGGRVVSQVVDSCPTGSNFMIQNLFFNVPARRKFLKSNQTELSNIIQEFERVVLVNPDIHFTFIQNDHNLMDLPVGTLKQRIAAVFGKKVGEQLLEINVDTTLCSVRGFVGKPETAKKKGAKQYFFINGRYMRHPYFHKAVQGAYEELIQPTEQVPYFLYLQADPSTIDVNIHPTKTEIKFENEVAIWQILMAAIKEALGRFNAVPVIDFDTQDIPQTIPVYNPANSGMTKVAPPSIKYDSAYNPFKESGRKKTEVTSEWMSLYEGTSVTPAIEFQKSDVGTKVQPDEPLSSPMDESMKLSDIERSVQHYQYRGQYIVTEVRSGMMLIDQHRAHTRVLYNRYREQMNGKPSSSQGLLFPELVQFPMSDVPLLEEVLERLKSLGFDISALGGGSYSVQAIPAGLEGVSPRQLLNDIVENLKACAQDVEEELMHRMALTLARNAAIPTGQVLTQQQMEALVDELFQQTVPNYTPDGKTIIIIYPHDGIERMFR